MAKTTFISKLIELHRLIVLGAPQIVITPRTEDIIEQAIKEEKSFPLTIDLSDNNDVPHLKDTRGSWKAIITKNNVEFIRI